MDTPENTDLSIQFLFEQKKNKEKNTANDLLNKNDRQKNYDLVTNTNFQNHFFLTQTRVPSILGRREMDRCLQVRK